ncbi:hypothetical protein [Microbacterium sp. MTN4-26]|uniref:hypothetical protein n=1 Tax=unclassified Microbacterium TaxID=2609290 RepID=UPI0036F3433C
MSTDDPIMQTRLDVAEMKGMLTQLVSSHAERLHQSETRHDSAEQRLNEKGKQIARLDERVNDLEDDNSARWGRVTGVLSLIISGVVGLVAIFNALRIGG